MTDLDHGLARGFLAECGEQLVTLEKELLALEKLGMDADTEWAERAFRLVHSIRGGAYFLELSRIGDLAHQTEAMMELIRSRKMAPTPQNFSALLLAVDAMHRLIQNPDTSNQADVSEIIAELARMSDESSAPFQLSAVTESASVPGKKRLRVMLVEDDFTSRLVLQTFLSRYGDCHIAVNGKEAVEACGIAVDAGWTYDLICMDIMMPEMDGREAVRRIRALEEAHGIFSTRGAKITMTTTVGDIKKVFQCFKELCDAYLVKPIDLAKLLGLMNSWEMLR